MNKLITVRKSNISGRGVYAKRNIPKGTKVIEYIGKKLTKAQAEKLEDDRYLFELNKRHDIDGNYSWNTAGFINHACTPNCEPENIRGRIWIISLHDIKKGEELSYNYGYTLENFEEHPCNCGTTNCVGYILAEEHWKKVRKRK
jgi:uncharacterized protein